MCNVRAKATDIVALPASGLYLKVRLKQGTKTEGSITMTLLEKAKAYSEYVAKIAEDQGMIFIEDSGEGRDLQTEDMYIEDISGWLSPKDIPDGERKNDKLELFTDARS